MPVTLDEIRTLAASLPRSYEVFVHGRLKFRVGAIVFLAISTDGSTMGCGFPKEFRQSAIENEPAKFSWPRESDLRFNWIHVNLATIDYDEMQELVEDAWSMCVPKFIARGYGQAQT